MNNKKVFLLLNGEPPNEIPDLSSYDIICATDGAYQFLKHNKITPHFISGDFDSLQELPENIEVINTPNQDFTDFDKILKILFDKGFKQIHVFGASGKEQDHFLGNLHTALQWKEKLNLTFYDNYSFYFLADKKTEYKDVKGKTISLIPYPKATGVITKGLQYTLNNEDLVFGKRIGTRNIALQNDIKVVYKTGDLFIFINNKR
jgi:thiamine pyrophosphokinase